MRPTMVAFAAIVLLCFARLSLAQDNPYGQCAITKEQVLAADISSLKKSCDPSIPLDSRCDSCLCAFSALFTPMMAANGVSVDVANLNREQVTDALMSCADVVLPAFEAAGFDFYSLADMAGCTQIPSCMCGAAAASSS